MAAMTAVMIAGLARAQVADDPDAVAPVVYSNAPLDDAACSSAVRNADGSPVVSCAASASVAPFADAGADADALDMAPDYADDDTSVYDVAPNFYLGVSLLPEYYWDPSFGWLYFAYAPFGYGYAWPYGISAFGYGFGWPYWGIGSLGGGYWYWHHHFAWNRHDHGRWTRYHGPYRYYGHGRYWDHGRDATRFARNDRLNSEPRMSTHHVAAVTPPGARANALRAAVRDRTRFVGAPAAHRVALPSASYVAAQRRRYAGSGMVNRFAPMAGRGRLASTTYRGSTGSSYRNGLSARSINARSANQAYRVALMPNRGYAASSYRGNSSARSYGYRSPRAYGISRGSYVTPHYSRGPAAGRGAMPSLSRSGGFTPHAGGGHPGAGSAHRH